MKKYNHQLHVIGGGKGKSRMAVSIAYLALLYGVKKIHIVFTNKCLMDKDQADFEDLWLKTDNFDKVMYHDDIDFEAGVDELIIFDEADMFMYE